jgi:bifunctional oligoribonuclease and PAP phosphatase NrnA
MLIKLHWVGPYKEDNALNNIETQITELGKLVDGAKTIMVLQPEKPDTDSLATSIALEHILSDLGKEVVMYSYDEVPSYLHHIDGWDRVLNEFPDKFDLTLLVDTGGPQMLTRVIDKYQAKLTTKPFVIVDHHKSREPMPFETIDVIDHICSATGELVVKISKQLGWKINKEAANAIVPSILADTRGLTVPTTTADTVQAVAEMVRLGANLYELNQKFREVSALDPDILELKGKLIQKIEYYHNKQIALIVIPSDILTEYADRHDPSDLVVYEMQGTRGVVVAAVMRNYSSELHGNKIKISMRANREIAAPAAKHFGGGGHPQAAGAKVEGRPIDDVKKELVEVLGKLIDETN